VNKECLRQIFEIWTSQIRRRAIRVGMYLYIFIHTNTEIYHFLKPTNAHLLFIIQQHFFTVKSVQHVSDDFTLKKLYCIINKKCAFVGSRNVWSNKNARCEQYKIYPVREFLFLPTHTTKLTHEFFTSRTDRFRSLRYSEKLQNPER
jgi:hypothetical protein